MSIFNLLHITLSPTHSDLSDRTAVLAEFVGREGGK